MQVGGFKKERLLHGRFHNGQGQERIASGAVGAFGAESLQLAVSGSEVYAAGYSTNSSSVLLAGYWKNGARTGLSPLGATKNSYLYSLVVSGSDVYAAGYSTNSSSVLLAGYWKNGARTGLSPLDETKSSWVRSLVVVE